MLGKHSSAEPHLCPFTHVYSAEQKFKSAGKTTIPKDVVTSSIPLPQQSGVSEAPGKVNLCKDTEGML